MVARITACAAALFLLACAKAPDDRSDDSAGAMPAATSASQSAQSGGSRGPAIVEREWALVTLGDSAAPSGSGGKPATIRFDSAASRAGGFAGCNRFSAPYTMAGDSLHFGPAISTKMACAEGDSLERAFLAVIPNVTGYRATDRTLTLSGSAGALAGFRAR
jgi:putative lipoprotein